MLGSLVQKLKCGDAAMNKAYEIVFVVYAIKGYLLHLKRVCKQRSLSRVLMTEECASMP